MTRRLLCYTIYSLLLYGRCALAQQPQGSVTGQVTNASTNEGLRKVTVTLDSVGNRGGQRYVALTDASGNFRVEGVEPGRYEVSGERNGFVRLGAERQGQSRVLLTLRPGQDLSGVSLKLTPQGVVTGRVLDEDGDAVGGAQVQLLRSAFRFGRRELAPVGQTSTNDIGEFRISGVPPGKMYLNISKQGPPDWARNGMGRRSVIIQASPMGYVPLFFPGVTDISQASPIAIQPGTEFHAGEIRLNRVAVYAVAGVVAGIQSGSRQSVFVQAIPVSGAQSVPGQRPALVQADGKFRLTNLASGDYILRAGQYGAGQRTARRRITVGSGDVTGLELTLADAINVTGAVRAEGADAAAPSLQVQWIPLDPGVNPIAPIQIQEGKFNAVIPEPGRYRVSVPNPPAGYFLKTIQMGGRDLEGGLVDLTSGAAGPLTIVLASGAPALSGIVQNDQGDPVARALVALVPDTGPSDRWDLLRSVQTDAAGNYQFPGVPPGSYRLYAWRDVDENSIQDPEFLRSDQTQAVAVKLEENATARIPLKVIAKD
jgi:hypothetical protein